MCIYTQKTKENGDKLKKLISWKRPATRKTLIIRQTLQIVKTWDHFSATIGKPLVAGEEPAPA